jgi:hypothetical protein
VSAPSLVSVSCQRQVGGASNSHRRGLRSGLSPSRRWRDGANGRPAQEALAFRLEQNGDLAVRQFNDRGGGGGAVGVREVIGVPCVEASVRVLCKRMFVQFEGAHLRERSQQGGWIDWWVVIVQRSVLSSGTRCQETRSALELQLEQPVVLMAQDGRGVPTYWGRPDLVDYMAAHPLETIPWQRFTLNAV